ncbi:hypothetical protein H8959_019039, partial [Pygathrix nigripes]
MEEKKGKRKEISSHLEDSESAALLCYECEESEIFSDSNEADSGEEECRSQPR